jgi:hypothetical protein
MAAGIDGHLWSFEEIAMLPNARSVDVAA